MSASLIAEEIVVYSWRMSLRTRAAVLFDRANKLAEQFYTPREVRALLLFLLLGVGVLLLRFGEHIYIKEFPKQRNPNEIIESKRQDSLYFALTTIARQRDSLFFSLPEDSLLPASVRVRTQHHSKADGLRLGSISLNYASKEDLIRLPGVGPVTAERILEYRSERGSFRNLEELKNVYGFGGARFEQIKRFLRLN